MSNQWKKRLRTIGVVLILYFIVNIFYPIRPAAIQACTDSLTLNKYSITKFSCAVIIIAVCKFAWEEYSYDIQEFFNLEPQPARITENDFSLF